MQKIRVKVKLKRDDTITCVWESPSAKILTDRSATIDNIDHVNRYYSHHTARDFEHYSLSIHVQT